MALPAVGRRVQCYFRELLLDPLRENVARLKKKREKKNIYKGKLLHTSHAFHHDGQQHNGAVTLQSHRERHPDLLTGKSDNSQSHQRRKNDGG